MKNEQQQFQIILLIVFMGFIGTSIAYPIFPPLFLQTNQHFLNANLSMSMRSILLGIALSA